MDNISFTGIKNIYIGKKFTEGVGKYINHNNELAEGNKINKTIKIACELTDDTQGKDLSFFKQQLEKCNNHYKNNCIDKNNPNKITMLVSRNEYADDVAKVTNSNFIINDTPILLANKGSLPLYTFMAKLTKRIAKQPETSNSQIDCLRIFNKSVHEEAIKIIDNM